MTFEELQAWARFAASQGQRADELTKTLLQPEEKNGQAATGSLLNNDGLPLQLCMTTSSSAAIKLRLIGDPASGLSDPQSRLLAARTALSQLLALTAANDLREACEVTLRMMLAPVGEETHKAGLLWLSGGFDLGAGLYLNTRWGRRQARWRDADAWLSAMLPRHCATRCLTDHLRANCALASIGLEGTGLADARAKLYWRLCNRLALSELGVEMLMHPALQGFVRILLGDRDFPLSGLVISAGFALADGELHDVKIDLCAHCLEWPFSVWTDYVRVCCSTLGLTSPEFGSTNTRSDLAFIGMGVNRTDHLRLNVYLKPSYERL